MGANTVGLAFHIQRQAGTAVERVGVLEKAVNPKGFDLAQQRFAVLDVFPAKFGTFGKVGSAKNLNRVAPASGLHGGAVG